MIKLSKIIKWILIIVLILASIFGILWITISSLIPPDKEKMEKYFQRDKNDLTVIANYLSSLEFPFVTISKDNIKDGVIFTGAYTGFQKITDEAILDTISKILNNKKYKLIGKSHNTVYFQKWSFAGADCGIATPLDEEKLPYVEFLIKSEPLSERGWYYYDADYETSRN